jgi:hypothetical protein
MRSSAVPGGVEFLRELIPMPPVRCGPPLASWGGGKGMLITLGLWQ